MKYKTLADRRTTMMALGLELATEKHYRDITREDLASAMNISTGNISRIVVNMDQFRTTLVAYAVEVECLPVIAQAVVDKHPGVERITKKLRNKAIRSL